MFGIILLSGVQRIGNTSSNDNITTTGTIKQVEKSLDLKEKPIARRTGFGSLQTPWVLFTTVFAHEVILPAVLTR